MLTAKQLVGMRVRLDPNKVTQDDLDDNNSHGEIGAIYMITDYSSIVTQQVLLAGSNWHYISWLTLIDNLVIGGELYDSKQT